MAGEPIRLLIAAMGGEGGGVLAGWITGAALAEGLWVQRTSVPGVAQRTGATTYYLEMLPRDGDRAPVLGLNPAPGRVDVVLASELLEAVRMVEAGFVSPERTRLIAATHRVFTVDEKSAMADGRLDDDKLIETCRRFAQSALMGDLAGVAARAGCHLNAVLYGVLIGAGVLPIGAEAARAAVGTGGKAVEANLRGFDAGLAIGQGGEVAPAPAPAPVADVAPVEALPGKAGEVAAEGVRRLTAYQNAAYAESYLGHLRALQAAGADEAVLEAVARQLALRMRYEDTIRVAEVKLDAARLAKVRAEARARPGEIVDVTEYMKPGPEEIFGMLPPGLGARLTRWAERRGFGKRGFAMTVTTTRVGGQLKLRALAALRRWRPRTLRHAQETAWVAAYLGHVRGALAVDPGAAREVAECAGLVRGYGDTFKRGMRNWSLIMDEIVTPTLAGDYPAALLADAVLQARLAASKSPEGTALDAMITAFRAQAGARAAE